MIPILAALVAFVCIAASARRLWFISNATALHPDELLVAVGRPPRADALSRLTELAARDPRADWERELFAALGVEDEKVRAALVNEQLTELDYRVQRWSPVPRVCASIATSFGFLLATLVLRRGLADAGELTGDVGELLVRGLVGDALTVAAFGVVGTAFCIGVNARARQLARDRLAATDRLVETLETLAPSATKHGDAGPSR